tara:strand:- start:963 stop:1118 length:156 start_codon:yes stop_codon:yes gene_type:complete
MPGKNKYYKGGYAMKGAYEMGHSPKEMKHSPMPMKGPYNMKPAVLRHMKGK